MPTRTHRQALPVGACFGPLLRWVLTWWPAEEHHLALALDATTLGQRFTVLALCLLYRGCALPIAWTVLPATTPSGWKKHWLALLTLVEGTIPQTWTVLVLAVRGLYAPWLFRAPKGMHWHPFLRIDAQGAYRRVGDRVWRSLARVTLRPGTAWAGEVLCFKKRRVEATLLARWEEGYAEPWLILTNLTPAQADVSWYAWRTWLECAFKTAKHGAWQRQKTHMTDPERAASLWLVLAVATLWSVSVGGEAEATRPAASFEALPAHLVARGHQPQAHFYLERWPPPARQVPATW